jgi:acyl carrier protein
MDINSFITNFANQLDDIQPYLITPGSVFRDLDGWSSVVSLSIMAMVDEVYDVQLTGDEMRAAKTIDDLFQIVMSKNS